MKKHLRILFNRIEKIGNYNHIGCERENENFGDFLARFVPEIGMKRKVKFTIEAIEEFILERKLLFFTSNYHAHFRVFYWFLQFSFNAKCL